jgi:anti-anti-sigma factor
MIQAVFNSEGMSDRGADEHRRTEMSALSEQLDVATYHGPDGLVVIRLAGSLDAAGAVRLMDETTRADPAAGDRVVVHLEDVTFLDSAGIHALCYTEAFVKARGGDFAVTAPGPRICALLELAGLGRYLGAAEEASRRPHLRHRKAPRRRPTGGRR